MLLFVVLDDSTADFIDHKSISYYIITIRFRHRLTRFLPRIPRPIERPLIFAEKLSPLTLSSFNLISLGLGSQPLEWSSWDPTRGSHISDLSSKLIAGKISRSMLISRSIPSCSASSPEVYVLPVVKPYVSFSSSPSPRLFPLLRPSLLSPSRLARSRIAFLDLLPPFARILIDHRPGRVTDGVVRPIRRISETNPRKSLSQVFLRRRTHVCSR